MLSQTEKELWIAALRSGEYRQGRGQLVSNDTGQMTYCCLGVLCKINGLTMKDKYGHSLMIPLHTEIDLGVANPTEIHYASYASFEGNGLPPMGKYSTLTSANDSGVSFLEIADHLEQFLPVKAASH